MKALLCGIVFCVCIFQNTFSMEYTGGFKQKIENTPYLLIKKIRNKSNKPIRLEYQGNLIVELGPRTTTKSSKQIFFVKSNSDIFNTTIDIINVNDPINRIVLEAEINTAKKQSSYHTISYLYKIEDEIFSLPSYAPVINHISTVYSMTITIDDLSPEQIKATIDLTPEKAGARQIEIEKE